MDGKEKALHELLKLIAENPDVVDRVTITIKPCRIVQSDAKPQKPKPKETK